jgi:hypothetical protein
MGRSTRTATIRVLATVSYLGDATARRSVTSFSVHDATIPNFGDAATPKLTPGASAVVSRIWDARDYPGQRQLKIPADTSRVVSEKSEGNNRLTKTVTVRRGWVVR